MPKVQNAEFVFQPGAFDYQAIRDQLGTGTKPAVDSETLANSNALAAYNAANQVKPATTPVVTPTTQTVTPSIGTTGPTSGASSKYTDAQVTQAIRESMAQGFSLTDSIAGATRVYGVPAEQVLRAADPIALEVKKKTPSSAGLLSESPMQSAPTEMFVSPVATQGLLETTPDMVEYGNFGNTQPTFSDAQVAQAILDSLGQGFTMDQARQGALANFGVAGDQFGRAVGMLPSMGYSIGQGYIPCWGASQQRGQTDPRQRQSLLVRLDGPDPS